MHAYDRYSGDVLATGWQQAHRAVSTDLELSRGLVLEDATTGFVGAVLRWENGLVVLEDRNRRRRSFPVGPGFWYEGRPVLIRVPGAAPRPPARTPSGSVAAAEPARARVAAASRIYVEGRHDAELVEKIWGADLREAGVVVEYLGGIDHLTDAVGRFAPGPGRRLGMLVDHLVSGSKEGRIADDVSRSARAEFVLVAGHPYVDVWQAVRPELVGLARWPEVPREIEWKHGACAALGWPHADQADLAAAWRRILGRVESWRHLEPGLLSAVERLIDFVTG